MPESDGAPINGRATHMPGNHTRARTRLTHADNTALACQAYYSQGVNTEVSGITSREATGVGCCTDVFTSLKCEAQRLL